MTIMMTIEDDLGNPHTLSDVYPIYFNNIQLGETKRLKVKLHNVGRQTTDVTVRAVAHPTAQLAPADQTYNVCAFSLTELGSYVPVLNVGTMSPNASIDIYVQWSMPTTAIPGWARFAMQADGVTEI